MAAECAAAAGAATGFGLFGYSRENYLYDADFRWERFTSGREYANQQAEQYRNDIRNMAGFYAKKNALWCTSASLTMALCVALYCAGRLGLHGASPPAWLIGLWYTNTATSFGYMAICIWLSMHAGFRASAAGAHLLTRKTRVPVPSLAQLDRARKFANEFEHQAWSDIFRVPYLSDNGAPKTDDASYGTTQETGRASSAPPGSRGRTRPSSWVREEFREDYSSTVVGSIAGPKPSPGEEEGDQLPEHFAQFAAAQEEFYEHDVYARVALFYGFISFINGLHYYGLGQINIELRAFWVAYATVFVLAVMHALILRFDIIPRKDRKRKEYLPHCEWLGPLAALPAAIATSLDFQVKYSTTSIGVCWTLIIVTYLMQLVYAARMLELIVPDDIGFNEADDKIGATWYPSSWKVPSSFHHVLYQVTPPTFLRAGQHDIVREIKEGGSGVAPEVLSAGGLGPERMAMQLDQKAAPAWCETKHVQPWKLMTTIQAVYTLTWPFLILGCCVDIIIGEQGLVTAPHWSRPPMTRLSMQPHELGTPMGFPWPAGSEPFLPEQMAWHEEKRHADHKLLGRRLQQDVPHGHYNVASFGDAVSDLLQALRREQAGATAAPEAISWPNFFQPKLLACGPAGHDGRSSIAALTPRGFGAVAHVGAGAAAAESLKLTGLMHLPPLMSASWGPQEKDGLLVVSQAGHLASCPGPRPAAGGSWRCGPLADSLPAMLPVSSRTKLLATAAAWLKGHGGAGGEPRLHAAFIEEHAPELVALFVREAEVWLPLGEVHVPRGRSGRLGVRASISFAGGSDIIIATEEGAVLRRRLRDGAVVASTTHHVPAKWQAACGVRHGSANHVAHLQLNTHRPEVSILEATSAPAVFQ